MPDHQVMAYQECVRRLIGQQAVLRSVLDSGDLTAPVPACPGWNLTDLAGHIGQLHRWVSVAITQGHPNAPTSPVPAGRAALLDWWDSGAGALVDLLGGTDPDEPCWTFGPHPRTARFWPRRQLHEHAVHAVDARLSQGSLESQDSIDPALAADGIDEVVAMFFPRQVRLGRIPALTRSLAVRPTDAPGAPEWVLAGDGVPDPRPSARPGAEATVSGPASALYLLLWRRIGLDDPRLTITGDGAAARSVIGTAIVP
jgi:uncharacterized protein (TIGR03083 family)